MKASALTDAQVIEEYRKRRTVLLTALALAAGAAVFGLWVLDPFAGVWWHYIFFPGAIVAYWIVAFGVWRCPRCHMILSPRLKLSSCPGCRAPFQ